MFTCTPSKNLCTHGGVLQVRVRVLNVDSEARKLVLSMRQKPRPPVGEQGDVSKYVAMLEEVRHTHGTPPSPFPIHTLSRGTIVIRTYAGHRNTRFPLCLIPIWC